VPAAILLATVAFSWNEITNYMIAYGLKYITLKVWGVDAYQKKGLRVATGLLFGGGVSLLMAEIACILSTLALFGARPLV